MAVPEAITYARRHALHVVLVEADGVPVAMESGDGWSADAPHPLYSGTKSFWGIAAAAAADDGLLRLDEPAADVLPEWGGDPRKAQVTIRQLLDLTAGFGFGGLGNAVPPAPKALARPLVNEPGTRFTYGGVPLQIFGEILRRKLAPRGRSPHDYLRERILAPAGVEIERWRTLADGTSPLPTGAFAAATAWLRYGRFLLAGGSTPSGRIVSAAAFAECVRGSVPNPRYGLGLWLDPLGARDGTIYASGAGGQALYVLPARRLIAVHFGKSTGWNHAAFLRRLTA